ncbi:sulfite exporter TauE/SafE family protein [Geomonas sp. Red69]|uniref:Sulfite exporter TauE/SafE family protein n=1 Tax=Geomonas diazotrophica TaxID=2843197 RepID=A0ABX8JLJ8_9BACT|nr:MULTISPECIES: sulfite exporter TauE/SafE family protein [Geomonas]MBU5637782.1 sulfite exporter TauE/SafE family protein [Geomonas diazotrophica]QWV96315.1 sulfite exporter TauE/SafE family protein [Geomonas nitrogeniifigens]QXE85382.1 sulfite exporter TauE/SafE family protein [Geomonas nitrogeniifigens]
MLQIWLAFVAGLAGSFHCIGMCGGIVAAISLKDKDGALGSRLKSQLFYNTGRIVTYTLLGALAGLIGSSLNLMAMKTVFRWFMVGANLMVIMVGLSSALGLSVLNLSTLEGSGARFLTVPVRRALAAPSPLASLPLGLVLGLLPCGLVYAPLLVAAGTGSPITGAATMAAMGLGTVPVMLGFGTASSAVSGALRNAMLRAAGIAIALMGVAGLWRVIGKMAAHH